MSWIEKLKRTYDNNKGHIADPRDVIPLLPLYHNIQNAQVCVVLDGDGNFKRATVIDRNDAPTIIPVTEESAGKAGAKIAPHVLCDKLQYIAGDYIKWGGNPYKKKNESGYVQYIASLRKWVEWSKDKKLTSVLKYLEKGILIKDLINAKILYANDKKKLALKWDKKTEEPPIFKVIKLANKKGQFESFVRFSVEIPDDMPSEVWKSKMLQKSWTEYYPTILDEKNLCIVEGKEINIASNHPKGIRYPGDGAKLLSSNDGINYTFRGRFTDDKEACTVGIEVTQKAHHALRWLIARQGRHDGDQAIVAWAVSTIDVPDPLADTYSLLIKKQEKDNETIEQKSYVAQNTAIKFNQYIAGYSVKLGPTDDVVVLVLDSATPGRMAIRYYRELTGSEYLERIKAWHEGCCWPQNYSKEIKFIGAPSPRDIVETAYGSKVDDKLKKATIERLLPCIVDGVPLPRDIVESCVRRASHRQGFKSWEWEKALGITCALYKQFHKERGYTMALDTERKTRDYLFGRLLAAADGLEGYALRNAGEKRPTNAARLMQRFADRPCSTWRTIELALAPSKARLGNRAKKYNQTIDDVMHNFDTSEFVDDSPLSGEFLLGFHSQRVAFWPQGETVETAQEAETENNE
ncbi:MAG: type I-C CRISPR-associated protein Cas8c/Csd1 [Candidatus Edwardsbacteria bacterium RIFOXYD12_FULL_50_11]|uniref:Type I-C CRISPR-associated protein Cas8c/Csd1 n=1 Tax=Candidatus Edwardsbacteria bacterium GWF2_54_11 TaxID=1817851 RepID=A0A1F5RF30_9BACT|nr:MAG: type I-C CRISPR-associated protein Cas8c/Csd1 [Candidatus Edwardsbacteria bacterium RifOxyC12_full_54_24]OGF07897.1 MAG: type I-C CRISPR-associated protein Cas8c/Csd1 [Candidatus Edwardsbacteria bacterium RifOxyA12_full_54_48]OGF10145.1 MAG: type I-C CRISPR-associated protein Cas8c/Csd1 [Candidatus Edwardsbacteria bacterium GWE2_54_12]OGF13087.1 MAG: type I-C CRISPR-associated protein Cas8c/Csd1 [Candidatus Edwardsbacteria bacterium GWF2_54_11]OGF15057.1 MAG: type I-C CRISPR-associated 